MDDYVPIRKSKEIVSLIRVLWLTELGSISRTPCPKSVTLSSLVARRLEWICL